MKIAFDHQAFAMQRYGGISRYVARLASELNRLGEEAFIIAPLHGNGYWNDVPPAARFGHRCGMPKPGLRKAARLANRLGFAGWTFAHRPDLIHETYYTQRSFAAPCRGRVITVHDMIHELFPEHFHRKDPTSAAKRAAVSRADHVITVSQRTKDDLCAIFGTAPSKVTVIPLGFDRIAPLPHLRPPTPKPFLLYVGDRSTGYKNFPLLLEAVARRPALSSTFDIVAFGGGDLSKDEQAKARALGLRATGLHHMSGDDRELAAAYSAASALVYPSSYEGFGLPPLEAMAQDCPVVAARAASIPEVAGDAAEYAEQLDADHLADAIERVVFDQARATSLIERGRTRLEKYSWSRCAEETLAVYSLLLKRSRNPSV